MELAFWAHYVERLPIAGGLTVLRKFAVLALFTSLLAAGIPAASASSGHVGRYIVVLHDSVDDPRAVANEHSRAHSARVRYVYEHALKGYAATMSDAAAARIANDRRVDYVEADGVVHKVATQLDPPSWGLDRIDDAVGLDKSYTYTPTGAGVRAYIIDTGIRITHTDFGGRAVSGTDIVDGDDNSDDCDGHGTHVAGTVGGSAHGVAKSVTLVGVRVLNCSGSGTWSGVIAGVDWVTEKAVKPAVANMSLGGGFNSSVNLAVENSTKAGITYAVAAGNGNQGGKAQDACNYSPASEPSALTVGATNSSDSKASWSNYGTCLDVFAPGVSITSTTMDGKTATWSGTSMASPHVAGVAALYLQGNPSANVATVSSAVTGSATEGVVSNEGPGSPDLLLYSLLTATEPIVEEPAVPVATDDSAAAVIGDTVTIDVLRNDSDANGDALTITNLTQPAEGGGSVAYSDTTNTAVTYTAPATPDTYTFTYTANDGTSNSNVATVTVEVTDPPPPPAGATSATIAYTTSGGKAADKHVAVKAVLRDASGNAVPNTAIEVWIYLNGSHAWTGTGTTLGDGSVTWEIKNAPSGTYTTKVVQVAGQDWSGTTQDGETGGGFTK